MVGEAARHDIVSPADRVEAPGIEVRPHGLFEPALQGVAVFDTVVVKFGRPTREPLLQRSTYQRSSFPVPLAMFLGQLFHSGQGPCVFGFAGEVGPFMRVGLDVV